MTGQQLKNSILQMAVQGKLVPQDPNDEPASVLLERIRKEKERLVREKKIKPEKNPSVIFRGADNLPYEKRGKEVRCIADEIPFEIPDSWEWARLSDVCLYIQRGKSPKYSLVKKYPVIAQKCNQWTGFSIEKAKFIEPESLSGYAEERLLQDQDLLWNSTGLGTLGRMAIYKADLNPYGIAVADSHVTVIRPFKDYALSAYLYAYFASPTVQSIIEDLAEGSTKQKELAQETVRNYLLPLPPIQEQHRIVSKIEDLLPYISEYNCKETTLAELNNSLPSLLKKSILQEAIQGKLVPQNPDDEPASFLLERIRMEKARLVKEGKLKPDKHESIIFRRDNSHYEKREGKETCIDDEIPFEIPASWVWARASSLGTMVRGRGIMRNETTGDGEPCIRYGEIYTSYNETFTTTKSFISIELDKRCLHLSNGDIVFTLTGENKVDIAKAVAFMGKGKVAAGGDLAYWTGHGMNPLYLVFYMASPFCIEQKRNTATGDIIVHISTTKVGEFLIPIPPMEEQTRIVEVVQAIFTQVATL